MDPPQPSLLPAIFSAIAASFAALAASVSAWVHLNNRRESVRPELVLDGWGRGIHSDNRDRIFIRYLRNVGRGPAIHTTIDSSSFGTEGKHFVVFATTLTRAILPVSDRDEIDYEIVLLWESADGGQSDHVHFRIELDCLDSLGNAHTTEYQMLAFRLDCPTGIEKGRFVVPGVMILARRPHVRSATSIGAQTHFRRIFQRVRDGFSIPPFQDVNKTDS